MMEAFRSACEKEGLERSNDPNIPFLQRKEGKPVRKDEMYLPPNQPSAHHYSHGILYFSCGGSCGTNKILIEKLRAESCCRNVVQASSKESMHARSVSALKCQTKASLNASTTSCLLKSTIITNLNQAAFAIQAYMACTLASSCKVLTTARAHE
jgi:hypothetical protein